jgi:hypothetical protein
MLSNIFIITILASFACAAALPSPQLLSRATQAADIIQQIAPTSNTCASAPAAGECATNAQAAPYLISAMQQYGVYAPSEIAAVLALISYESGDFKYNTNHYPGRAGQGTRNMMMPNYVLLYAKSIPALATQLSAITASDSITGLSDDQLNAVRALVLPDAYTWGSGAWFLTTQCASVRPALQAGGQAGFEAYMSCLGVTATSDRLAYWTRANAAFGLA